VIYYAICSFNIPYLSTIAHSVRAVHDNYDDHQYTVA